MSVMRKKIAEHMVVSRRTSAHVHSVFEVNFSRVAQSSRGEEGRIREGGREAHLPVVHHQGGRRRAASRARRQRVDRRRQHRLSPRREHRHRRRARLGTDRSGDQEGRRAEPARHQPRGRRSGDARARQAAQAGRGRRRDVHDHQSRRLRRALRHADHQPAAGRDSRRRRDREAAGRHRRCDRDSADGLSHARLRPPADRRRGRRPVHVARQAAVWRTGTRRADESASSLRQLRLSGH